MGLALAVVLAALWPMAVEASVSRDVSFKASPLAAAKVLPQMQTPAEDALAKTALVDECEALCELAASVDAAPLGYVSWRRPPIGIVFLYDDTSLLAEYDTNGNEVAKYDYGGDRLIRLTWSDEGTRYFSFDGLGSVTGLTDTTGAVTAAYHLDAWGNYRFTQELAPSKNRFGFTGHYWDNEAGLYYAKARYYDPFTARFTQADSFLGNIDDPPSLHRYFYAHANPTFYTDPTGNYSWNEFKGDAKWGADFTLAATKDLAQNGLKRGGRIAYKTAKNVMTIVEEAPATILDAGVLTLQATTGKGSNYQLRSSLGRSTAERMARGESAADITQEIGIDVAMNLVNGQVISEDLKALTDYQTGRATIDQVEDRLGDAAASGVTNAGLAVGLKKGYDSVRAASAAESVVTNGGGRHGVNLLEPKQLQPTPAGVRFGSPRGGGGSTADRAYASRVSGGAEKSTYVNGTEFDSVRGGVLVDAKRASGSGSFYDISGADRFTQNVKIPEILKQANRQVNAAQGQAFRGIRWKVADAGVAAQLRRLFRQQNIPITVVHTP